MGYMLAPLRLGFIPPGLRIAFRVVKWVTPWAMVEVFVVGALVAYGRLNETAPVTVEPAFYALGLFVFLLAAADATYEPHAVWHRVRDLQRTLRYA
jgi:paraquat-inducible protein A